jgi:hypothetical protein
MKTFHSIFAGVAVAGAWMAGSPEGVAAKCGLTPTVPEVALIIDGRWVLEVNPYADLYNPTGVMDREVLDRAGVELEAEEILMINLGCHTERDETTGTVKIQSSVIVTTVNALEDALVRLSGLQETYREANGRYATSFTELPTLPILHGVSLTMGGQGSGWTSSARFSNSPVICHLAAGDAELSVPGQTLGQVSCTRPTTPRN